MCTYCGLEKNLNCRVKIIDEALLIWHHNTKSWELKENDKL
jgi:hypothetical protein